MLCTGSISPSTTENGKFVQESFVGWGGTAPITLPIENIIGLEFNAPENTVTFHLHAREKCGLENGIQWKSYFRCLQ